MQEIKLGKSRALINETGAELKSFKVGEKELIWQTNPSVWNSSAPVLFPFVGLVRDNKYSFNGKEYEMSKHGFVRNKTFKVAEKSDSSVKLLYSYNEETLKVYPFKFDFTVTFSIVKEEKLLVEYNVKNLDSGDMYFSLGSHPAINLPLEGTCHEDYFIEFEKPETVYLYKLVNGLLEREKNPFMKEESVVKLSKHTFDDDALIFTGINSKLVYLKNPKTRKKVRVCLGGAPDLGIWAKPGADYVCIEPWFGYNDPADFRGDIKNKPGIIKLEASAAFDAYYAVETMPWLQKMFSKLKGHDSSVGSYQSDKVYQRPIMSQTGKIARAYEGVGRNPVIVIHGFLGAHLTNSKTGDTVWGSFQGIDLIRGFSEKELSELALPMEKGKTLHELRDDINPSELLKEFDINLLGIHIKKSAYDRMVNILEEAGYVNADKPLPANKKFYSLFLFYYDWRRDLAENAAILSEFIKEKRHYLQEKYKEIYDVDEYDVHFDIAGHSMGGLLARYFLRYGGADLPQDGSLPKADWAGAKYVDKMIIIGTPNAGYLDTCSEMINGLQIARHTPLYPPAVIGTFHAYYQMMPLPSTKSVIYDNDPARVVDMFDLNTWINMKWGLANPAQDKYLKILLPDVNSALKRRGIALDHLDKCLKRARHFIEAMSAHISRPPANIMTCLFCGNAVETSALASVNSKTGEFKIINYEAGDGKVLSSSARLDERAGKKWTPYTRSPIDWDAVIHLRAAHMGITDSYGFANNFAFYLLGMPPKNYSEREKIVVELMEKYR